MTNRRPLVLLASCAAVAVIGAVLAAVFDEQKGWNHPGQAVANLSWIAMLIAILGIVLTTATLVAGAIRRRRSAL